MLLCLFASGCLITVSDPEAEAAVEMICRQARRIPETPLSLKEVLEKLPSTEHLTVRIAFASLLLAEKERNAGNIMRGEKARITLNTLLGFLPGDSLHYDLTGVWECPEELPAVSTAEKAALIIDGGKTPAATLLTRVRLAHLQAVTAMNDKTEKPTAGNSFAYLRACVLLAREIGVPPEQLEALDEYEKRFDAARERQRKLREK